MRISRLSIGVSILSLTLLAGCASKVFGPSSADRAAYAKRQEQAAAGSGVTTSPAAASESSQKSVAPPIAFREINPEVIDILDVFQKKLTETPDGFDTETVVSASGELGQLMLITKGVKLHRFPEQNRIFYVISGRGDIVLDGKDSSIRAGHIVVVPLGVSLKITPSGDLPLRLLVFKAPGNGHSNVEWLKEQTPQEGNAPEQEVQSLQPVNEAPQSASASSESSSEEFQTGTLTN